MRILVLSIVVLASTQSTLAQAQPVDSIENLWSRMKSGNTVYVTDATARETRGIFVKLSDTALTLDVDGQAREIQYTDVRQIEKRGDSVLNGFLIGAAIGGGIGAAMGASNCSDCGEDQFPLVPAMIVGALEFGGIGALVDYFIKGRTVVYRGGSRTGVQLTPLVFAHHRGVRLNLAF
jgi:hypothetical protein